MTQSVLISRYQVSYWLVHHVVLIPSKSFAKFKLCSIISDICNKWTPQIALGELFSSQQMCLLIQPPNLSKAVETKLDTTIQIDFHVTLASSWLPSLTQDVDRRLMCSSMCEAGHTESSLDNQSCTARPIIAGQWCLALKLSMEAACGSNNMEWAGVFIAEPLDDINSGKPTLHCRNSKQEEIQNTKDPRVWCFFQPFQIRFSITEQILGLISYPYTHPQGHSSTNTC